MIQMVGRSNGMYTFASCVDIVYTLRLLESQFHRVWPHLIADREVSQNDAIFIAILNRMLS